MPVNTKNRWAVIMISILVLASTISVLPVTSSNLTTNQTMNASLSVLIVDADSANDGLVLYYGWSVLNYTTNVSVWDVYGNNGPPQGKPNAGNLAAYNVVIWIPGRYMGGGGDFDATDEGEIAGYLNGGGTFMLANSVWTDYTAGGSMFYGPGDFAYDYMGLDSIFDPASFFEWTVTGLPGTIFDGFGPAFFDWMRGNWGGFCGECDDIWQGPGTVGLENDGFMPAGLYYDSGTFKTVFFGFGFEALPGPDADDVMSRILQWFVPTISEPDIWVNPTSFDFVVQQGQIDSDIMTIGNNGTGNLYYNITCGVQAVNPVAHWKLDETSGSIAYDSMGFHNGTNVGALMNQPGVFGTSYRFNGGGDRIAVSHDAEIDFTNTDDFSVYAWINTTSANYGRIVEKRLYPGSTRGYTLIVWSNGTVRATLTDGTTAPTVYSNGIVTDGLWHHVGMVKQGNSLELFVDGVSQGINTTAVGNFSNNDYLFIGTDCGIYWDYNGYIDDVRIYDEAVSPNEVLGSTSYFIDDFDGEAEGTSPPANWVSDSSYPPDNLEVDDAQAHSGPHSMWLRKVGSGLSWCHHDIPAGVTDEKFTMWVYFASTTTRQHIVTNRATGDHVASNIAAQIQFRNDGSIWYFDGAYQSTGYMYTTGWHEFNIIHDCPTDQFDMWYDGIQIINDGGFRNSASSIKALHFQVDASFGTNNMWIDDVQIEGIPQSSIFEDNFDSETEGTSPPVNWVPDTQTDYIPIACEVDNIQSRSGPHSLYLESPSTWYGFCHHDIPGGSTDEPYYFSVYPSSTTMRIFLNTQNTVGNFNVNNIAVRIALWDDGFIRYNSGGAWNITGYAYVANSWNNFTVIPACVNNTFDCWHNGVLIVDDGAFYNPSTSIMSLHFGVSSVGSPDYVWIDDVEIGYSPPPPTFFYDNFDSETEGTGPPINWVESTLYPPLNCEVDDVHSYSSPHSMWLRSPIGDMAAVHHDVSFTTEPYELMLYFDNINERRNLITQAVAGDIVGSGLEYCAYLQFDELGRIRYYDGAAWIYSGYNYSTGWHKFRIIHDHSNSTFDAWYDGTQVLDDCDFTNSGKTSVESIHIRVVTGGGNLWVDDVQVGQVTSYSSWPDWLTVSPLIGSLPPSGIANHTVTVNTTTLTPGFYQANFSIESNDPDENPVIVTVNLTVIPFNQPLMSITKNATATANPGELIAYTISYQNIGSATAYNPIITETYPSDVTFISAVPPPNVGDNVWQFGNLAPGAGGTISITVQVNVSAVGTLVNYVELTYENATVPQPPVNANAATQIINPNIIITKESPPSASPGNQIPYWINITNIGNDWADNIVITDTYPAGVTYVSAVPLPDIGDNIWLIASLAPNFTVSIEITVLVDIGVPWGTWLINNVTVDYENSVGLPYQEWAEASTFVGGILMEITKTAPATTNPGDTIMYVIDYQNNGLLTAYNVTITETYPLDVTFVDANPPPDLGDDVWLIGTLLAGEGGRIYINVTVSPSAMGVLTNQVELNYNDNAGIPQPTEIAWANTTVFLPLMLIDKTAPATASEGQTIMYTISYQNVGSDTAYTVIITDIYPADVTFVNSTPAPSFGDDTWIIGDLLPGEGGTIYINVTINMGATGVLTNDVVVDYWSQGGIHYQNFDSASTTIIGPGALMILTKDAPATANPGETITYVISYSNVGTESAYNVTITETYSPNITFVNSTPWPDVDNNIWLIGTVPPGAGGTIYINVTVNLNATGVLINSVELNYENDVGLPYPSVFASAQTVVNNPSMVITKEGPSTASPGEIFTYWINYSNIGTDTAYNVVITENYPAGVTFISAVPLPSIGNNIWIIPAIAPGASGSIQITVQVDANATGNITNYVEAYYENGAGIPQPPSYDICVTTITGPGPVHNIDTDEYFDEIQTAIADPDTLNGHTIEVSAGTYFERVLVNKSVNLVGEHQTNTTIDGFGGGDILLVVTNWVNISGFTLTNGSNGIQLSNADYCRVENVTSHSNLNFGIFLIGADFNKILNNTAYDNTDGILVHGSYNNTLFNNTVRINSWGVYLDSSLMNIISSNYIYLNNNSLSLVANSDQNTVLGNLVLDNVKGIVLGSTCWNNLVYANSIINNTDQAVDYNPGNNSWNATYPIGGNYWDDYNGTDTMSGPNQTLPGPDGFGDTPYVFDFAQDNYPLMSPGNWTDNQPPEHLNEFPAIDGWFNNATPVISVHITDISGVNQSTIRLWINGFMVFYDLGGITNGYNVSYWHEGGFFDGQVVGCRIVADDIHGNTLDFTWYFTVDLTAPWVTSTDPFDGEIDIPLDYNISVYFSESMDMYWTELAFDISPFVNGTFWWLNGTDGFIFEPFGLMQLNTTYTVTISSVARDLAGNRIVTDYVWNFTTEVGDIFPPEHSNEFPAINGYCTELDPTISVHVTDLSGVNASTIRFYVCGFRIFHGLTGISDGFNVSYWHETGFSPGEVVTCRIMAQDLLGNQLDFTWSFTVLSTFDVDLHFGWNLVSFPLVPLNTSILNVLSSIDGYWDIAEYYFAWDTADPWKSYAPAKPPILNDLWDLNNTMSFWLHVTNVSTLTVQGLEPGNSTIPLKAGWNMVGYPSLTQMSILNALVGTGYDAVEGYDNSSPYLKSPLNDTYMMKPGEGYFVHVPSDTLWVVDW